MQSEPNPPPIPTAGWGGSIPPRTPERLASTYDAWATTYDLDMLRIGYANPAVAAALVARHVRAPDSRILDAGVGTGIIGEILSILGYRDLTGIDISEGMLAKARERNVYSELRNRVLGEPLDFDDGAFSAVVSFGVFTPGHAPAAAFDELTRVTRPGGHLIFTVSTAAWRDGDFRQKLHGLEQAGRLGAVEIDRRVPTYAAIADGVDLHHTRLRLYRGLNGWRSAPAHADWNDGRRRPFSAGSRAPGRRIGGGRGPPRRRA